jgi:hypothetical protein
MDAATVAVILLVLAGILLATCAGSRNSGARNEAFAKDDPCPPGFYRDAKNRCVRNIYDQSHVKCPDGQEKDKSGACVKICPPGMKNVKGRCECPPGLDNVDGRCVTRPCPPGQENVGGRCVTRPCPPGQENVGGRCVLKCPPGQMNIGGRCVCPHGQENVGGRCMMKCPPGTGRDVRGKCVKGR